MPLVQAGSRISSIRSLRALGFALFLIAFITPSVWAAPGCQSNGTGGGAWNAGATWTGCAGAGGVPATTDDVTIDDADSVTLTTSATVASLTFSPAASSTTTLTVSSPGALTVSGTLTIDGSAGGSGKIAVLSIGSGASVTVNGAGGVAGGNVAANSRLTFTGSGTLTTTILASGLTFTGATGSTVVLKGTGTVPVFAYNNLTINGSGITATLGGAISVSEALTLTAGTLDTSASNFALTAGGITTVSTGTTLNGRASTVSANGTSITGGGTIAFTGAGTLNIGGDNTTSGTFTAGTSTVNYNKAGTQTVRSGITYNNLTLSGSGTKDLTTATTVGGMFALSGTTSSTAGGALTLNNVTAGSGTTLALGASSHTVSGNATIDGTLTPDTSTVAFNGTTQSLAGTATTASFNNLTVNGGSTLTVGGSITTLDTAGTLTVNGTLSPAASQTISGAALTGSGTARTPSLAGFLSQYTQTSKTLTNLTVAYNGAAAQTISAAAYGGLTMNNASGGTLDGSASVANALTLTTGNITTGVNSLTIGAAGTVARTSGHVIGDLIKTFAAASTKTFEVGTANGYSPVDVNATAGTFPGNFTVRATQAAHPNSPGADALQRYWTTTSSDITAADLTFHYLDPADIAGAEAAYSLGRWTGTAWVYPASSLDTTNNFASTNGATAFGDYTLHERATKLIITSVNGGADVVAGVPFSVTVQSLDSSNNPAAVTGDTGISLSVFTGTAGVSGTTTGSITANTNSTVIGGVVYTKAEGVQLQASATSGDTLTAGNSALFNVVAAAADHLTFTSATTPLHTNAARTLTAEIRDVYENVRTADSTTSVTFAKTGGAGTVTGLGSATAASGIASLGITGGASGSITIDASATGMTAGSTTFTIVNDTPAATPQSVTLNEDTPTGITLAGTDPETETLTFAIVDQPLHGQLTGTAPNVTYTPALNYNGSDSFTFTVSDSETTSTAATVSITVDPVNDAPVANNQNVTTSEGAPVAITLTGSDIDLDSLTFNVTSSPAKGVLSGTAPNLTYTPNPTQSGADSFTFTVFDGNATSGAATVSINITPIGAPSTAGAPPYLVKDIDNAGSGSPAFITALADGRAIFRATEPVSGAEPWVSNGTLSGTTLLVDVEPGADSSTPADFTTVNTLTFFSAATFLGRELWQTNGLGSTAIVQDINGSGGSNPASLTKSNALLFFSADNGTHGTELWSSNGTSPGTFMVLDIAPASSSPAELTDAAGTLFFSAADVAFGRELWKSDGSPGGTSMVKDIAALGLSSTPHNLSYASGKLYFSVEDGGSDELWTSDGSSGGTLRVKDINTSGGDDVSVVVGLGGGIGLFAANDGTNGRELWKTDGSEANTQLVLDANSGAGSGVASFTKSNAVVAGTLLYFNADDGIHGVELWKSDGTAAGTEMVKDICPGACSSNPASLVASGAKVYFRASNPYVGDEVWVSDGSGAGTALTGDLEPGSGGSSPASLAKAGNLIYFSATTTASGNELHALCTTTATHYLVTGPSSVSPGTSASIVVTPRDASNALVPCYTGTVHFTSTDGAATLPDDYTFVAGEGAHTFPATFNTTGNITITATDTVTGTITGNAIVPVRLATTTTLVSSENPSLTGQSVTFTATVSSLSAGTITGTVTFKDGATTIGSGPVSGGTATFTTSALAHGVHSITAAYGGDTNFDPSVSDALSQTVNTSAFGPPAIFLATATSSTNVALSWTVVTGATSYEVWRSSGGSAYALLTSTGGTNLNDTVSANTTYLYKVRALNGGGPSAFSTVDAATTVVFTDAPLTGVLVKAVHLTQLRTAVNAMRAAASLAPATFTDASPSGVLIKAVHITELRTALDAARSVIGLSVLGYTDPTITAGTTAAKAAHTTELRAGTQ